MIAVVVILVAVVLLVLVVVALGMRSMNRRESSLPPERLKAMAEREEMTQIRSTDEFAAHEPRMVNFSPDFSPIDEQRQPRPVRTGQRGKRGVDEWGNGSSDDEDEEFWANIRSDAEEGGFGAGGTVAARKGASRPVKRDPDMETTIQAPLPQRPVPAPAPAAASAGLADLVEHRQQPSVADLADQRTVTFSAPTPDVMSILGAGAQPVAPPTSSSFNAANNSGSFQAVNNSGSFQATNPNSGSFQAVNPNSGSFQAVNNGSGSFPAVNGSGSFPAVNSSGSFPAQPQPIHAAPTSDPFPAYGAVDPLETTWQTPPAATTNSGSWAAAASHDILDDPGPATGPTGSWPAFETYTPNQQPPASYPNSYEVRSGYAAIPEPDALTGPSPATGTPTAPGRAVSPYEDVLSGYEPNGYQPNGYSTPAAPSSPAAWPEPPASATNWPTYGEMYGTPEAGAAQPSGQRGNHRAPEQDYPDYYR